VLAFAPAAGDPISQIVWFDREGKSLQAVTPPGDYYGPRLSRDGSMLAVTTIDPQTGSSPDVWVYELSRGVGRRLTGGGSLADFSPMWSPDGREIAEFKGQAAHWLRRLAETGEPVVITQNGRPAGVLLSPSEFDRLQERQRFLESIAKGLADAEAGRLMETRELKRRLVVKRVPPESE